MVEMCQGLLDRRGMLDELAMSVVVAIFKVKRDAMSCGGYRGVNLLQHAMKIVEKVLEMRLWRMLKADETQFGLCQAKKQ